MAALVRDYTLQAAEFRRGSAIGQLSPNSQLYTLIVILEKKKQFCRLEGLVEHVFEGPIDFSAIQADESNASIRDR